jgi:hypothetical protein
MTVLLLIKLRLVIREYLVILIALLHMLMYSRFYTTIITSHHESSYGR